MTGLLRIERAYIEQNGLGPWEEVSQDEFLRRTEWAGYYKSGTALLSLHDLGEIRTPFLFFRLLNVNESKSSHPFLPHSGGSPASPCGIHPAMERGSR